MRAPGPRRGLLPGQQRPKRAGTRAAKSGCNKQPGRFYEHKKVYETGRGYEYDLTWPKRPTGAAPDMVPGVRNIVWATFNRSHLSPKVILNKYGNSGNKYGNKYGRII